MKKTYKYINKMGDTFEIQNGQYVRLLDDKEKVVAWCETSRGGVRIPTIYIRRNFVRTGYSFYRLDELRTYGYDIDDVRD